MFKSILYFIWEQRDSAHISGIEAAKKKNVRFGRPSKPLPDNWRVVLSEVREGTKKPVEAIRELGISRSCYYRLFQKL